MRRHFKIFNWVSVFGCWHIVSAFGAGHYSIRFELCALASATIDARVFDTPQLFIYERTCCSRRFAGHFIKFNHVWCRAWRTYLEVHIVSSRSSAIATARFCFESNFSNSFLLLCMERGRWKEEKKKKKSLDFPHRIPKCVNSGDPYFLSRSMSFDGHYDVEWRDQSEFRKMGKHWMQSMSI